MHKYKIVAVALSLLLSTTASKAQYKNGDFVGFHKGRLGVPITPDSEIEERQKELLSINETNIPKGYTGTLLFDFEVLRRSQDRYKQKCYRVKPFKFYTTHEHFNRDTIDLVSPTIECGGEPMQLQIGHSYRVMALDFDDTRGRTNRLYFWKGCIAKLELPR